MHARSRALSITENKYIAKVATSLLAFIFFFLFSSIGKVYAAITVTYQSTDGNGVKTYQVSSNNNGNGTHLLKVLEPNTPDNSKLHNFLYVLPVEAESATTFGNGLETLRALNAHNAYNVTLIAPEFDIAPWYANHATNPDYQYETFMVEDLQPWVTQNLSQTSNEQHWLLGFSKSGYGPIGLLFKHPDVFTLGAFWDFPANMSDYNSYSAAQNYGTQENFDDNYKLTDTFISNYKNEFLSDNRLWISGYKLFQTDVTDFASLLTNSSIVFTNFSPTERNHRWDSGWLPDALQGLYANSIVFPSITNISASSISDSTADISWHTDKLSSSKVEYGTVDSNYTASSSEQNVDPRVASHSVKLTQLKKCTKYYFRVKSKNSILNQTTSSQQTFTTSGCTSNSTNDQYVTDSICEAEQPKGAPNLFLIERLNDEVKLFISPDSKPYTDYLVSYGIEEKPDLYSDQFSNKDSTGVITHTIGSLETNTTYVFKVRAQNGCRAGDWSNSVQTQVSANKEFRMKLSSTDQNIVEMENEEIPQETSSMKIEQERQVMKENKVIQDTGNTVESSQISFIQKLINWFLNFF